MTLHLEAMHGLHEDGTDEGVRPRWFARAAFYLSVTKRLRELKRALLALRSLTHRTGNGEALSPEQQQDVREIEFVLRMNERHLQCAWTTADVPFPRTKKRTPAPRVFALAEELFIQLESSNLASVTAGLSITERLRLPAHMELAGLLQLLTKLSQPHDRHTEARWCCQTASRLRIASQWTGSQCLPSLDLDALISEDGGSQPLQLDVATKCEYWYQLEKVAVAARTNVARALEVATAIRNSVSSRPASTDHLGCLVAGTRQKQLLMALGVGPLRRFRFNWLSPSSYYALILSITAMLIVAMAVVMEGTSSTALIMLCGALIANDTAVTFAQVVVREFSRGRRVASMDCWKALPKFARTAVVVPTMLISEAQVDRVIARLLENIAVVRDPNVTFVLLPDFPDSPLEQPDAEDVRLREHLMRRVQSGGSSSSRSPIVVMGRSRRFSNSEQKWIGWERKRGKIAQFFQFIRGEESELVILGGDANDLCEMQFACVLDDDNRLTPRALNAMVGALLHPSNRTHTNSDGVMSGHALVVPRLDQQLSTATPWDFVPRDSVFDVFGEVSFPGKGLYDVAAFSNATKGRIPEEAVLSHDLFEGFWTRPMFLSTSLVVESAPSDYVRITERQHRWIRGDVQNFLLMITGAPSQFPKFAWLTIMAKLRAIAIPIATVVGLFTAMSLPRKSVMATIALLFLLILPSIIAILRCAMTVVLMRFDPSARQEFAHTVRFTTIYRVLQLAMAPHRALVSIDATCRAIARFIVRRRLLQWESSEAVEATSAHRTLSHRYLFLSVAIVSAFVLLSMTTMGLSKIGVPILVLWLLAPLLLLRVRREASRRN